MPNVRDGGGLSGRSGCPNGVGGLFLPRLPQGHCWLLYVGVGYLSYWSLGHDAECCRSWPLSELSVLSGLATIGVIGAWPLSELSGWAHYRSYRDG